MSVGRHAAVMLQPGVGGEAFFFIFLMILVFRKNSKSKCDKTGQEPEMGLKKTVDDGREEIRKFQTKPRKGKKKSLFLFLFIDKMKSRFCSGLLLYVLVEF